MPFTADLRAGYFKIDFNMAWFYEVLADSNREVEFLPTKRGDGTEDERIAYSQSCFEEHIEKKAREFIIARCGFGSLKPVFGLDYKLYDNIWEFLLEELYSYEHLSELKITDEDN